MNLLNLLKSNSAPKTYAQRRRALVWAFNGIAAAACCFSIFAAQAYLKPAAETYGMGETLASVAAFATGATLDVILIYSLRSFVADLTAHRYADGILLAVFAAAAGAYGFFLNIATENRANADAVAMYQDQPSTPSTPSTPSIPQPTTAREARKAREAEARAAAAEARRQEAANAAREAVAAERQEVIKLTATKHNNSKATATLLLCLALVMQAAAGYITNKKDVDQFAKNRRKMRNISSGSVAGQAAHAAPNLTDPAILLQIKDLKAAYSKAAQTARNTNSNTTRDNALARMQEIADELQALGSTPPATIAP